MTFDWSHIHSVLLNAFLLVPYLLRALNAFLLVPYPHSGIPLGIWSTEAAKGTLLVESSLNASNGNHGMLQMAAYSFIRHSTLHTIV